MSRVTVLLAIVFFGSCTSPGATLGQPCTADSDCRFALCIARQCSGSCDNDDHCLTDQRCERRTVDADAIVGACVPEVEGACSAASDCADGQTCVAHQDDKTLDFACSDGGHPLLLPLGSACELADECLEGLCLNGRCTTVCASDFDCISDLPLTCDTTLIAIDEASIERDTCIGPPTCERDQDCDSERCTFFRGQSHLYTSCAASSGAESGQACVSDHDCAAALCVLGTCRGPCAGDDDCLDDQSCRQQSVALANGSAHANICVNAVGADCAADADCTLPDVCMAERADALAFECGTIIFDGSNVGASCTDDAQCARNLCVNGICAQPCVDSCGAEDILCRTTQIDLTVGSALAEVCLPASVCVDDGDCAAGDACVVGVWPNVDSTTICLPRDTLKRPTGMPCDSDDQCQSNVCIDTGLCSEPCEVAGDCWLSEYACEPRPVTGAPELWAMVCVPPPPAIPCAITSDCSELPGVCGNISFGATNEAYCVAPIPGGAQLGESCSGSLSLNLVCRDRVCLTGVSNACSTPCILDADCTRVSAGFACTDLPYADGARFCVESCTQDASCAAEHRCALSVNTTDDRYDFFCRLPSGTMAVGSDCSSVNDCDHGLCLRLT